MPDLANNEKNTVVIEGKDGSDLTVNTNGTLNIGGNLVSSNNSTTALLGSSGVFTGTGEDVLEATHVTVSLKSDVGSATAGLSIQFSTDNTNWDHLDTFTVPANIGKTYTVQRVARYFRIVYTNGTTAQSFFRLQTILNTKHGKSSTHRIQDSITVDDDAELTKAITAAQDTATGTFTNLKTTAGRLLVSQEVAAPVGTTEVSRIDFGNVSSTSGIDDLYTITNGKTLTLQLLQAVSESEIGGSLVELFEDPNGNLSVLNRIGLPIITDGSFNTNIIGRKFVGNGTRRIVMRRRGYSASNREIGGRWIGFEE